MIPRHIKIKLLKTRGEETILKVVKGKRSTDYRKEYKKRSLCSHFLLGEQKMFLFLPLPSTLYCYTKINPC
jgi:hypothetical protein